MRVQHDLPREDIATGSQNPASNLSMHSVMQDRLPAGDTWPNSVVPGGMANNACYILSALDITSNKVLQGQQLQTQQDSQRSIHQPIIPIQTSGADGDLSVHFHSGVCGLFHR